MSASHELQSIADSLAVLARCRETVEMGQDELSGLAYALRDLSVRVGYMETRSVEGFVGRAARRAPISETGAEIIPFPRATEQAYTKRKNSAA